MLSPPHTLSSEKTFYVITAARNLDSPFNCLRFSGAPPHIVAVLSQSDAELLPPLKLSITEASRSAEECWPPLLLQRATFRPPALQG